MKDIFNTNGSNILDLSTWTKYVVKSDFEKGFYSEYFKKTIPEVSSEELSIGVFYILDTDGTFSKDIHHIAWGIRKEKDCSFNAIVKDGKFIENIIAGCPCDDLGLNSKDCRGEGEDYLMIYIFLLITIIVSMLYVLFFQNLSLMNFMTSYMAFFFLIFGALKISNLRMFSKMFGTYDLIAKKVPAWGYIYPVVEIMLGLLYFFFGHLYLLNLFTGILMALTSISIYLYLRKGKKTQCACLGGYFNVPLSWVTFWENFAMFLMAIYMLLWFFTN